QTENTCAKCHSSQRQQVKDAIINGIAGQLQDCTNCHGAEDTIYHPTPPTSAQHDMVSATVSCMACHVTNTMGDIYAVHLSDCTVCHGVNVRQDVKDAVENGQSFTANPPPDLVTCVTCHPVGHKQADGHLFSLGSLSCDTCHSSLSTPAEIVTLHDVATNGAGPCATCHNSLRQPVLDTIISLAASTCSHCHNPYTADYANHTVKDHSGVTGVALCTSCHTGNLISDVHGNGASGTCTLCHIPLTGVLIDGLNSHGTAANGSGTCTFCHNAYFSGHSHSHNTSVTINTSSTPTTAACTSCHTATASPFVGSGEVHAQNGCATCHSTVNSARIGSAIGASGECTSCHTTYFTGHNHSHVVTMQSGIDQSQGNNCNFCHAQFSNTWVGILGLHNNNCTLCHNATRETMIGSGITIPNIISARTNPTGCLICHPNNTSQHGLVNHSVTGLNHVTDTASCVALCHLANNPMAVHQNTCSLCHTSTPTLADPANRNHVTAIQRGSCSGCHTTYFSSHSHDHTTTVTSTTLCVNCHLGNIITAVHKNTCATCHSNVNGARIPGANGRGDASVNSGIGGTCAECHPAYFSGHTHSHTNQVAKNVAVTPATANCTGCHSAITSPFIALGEVHASQGCVTCHDTTINGELIAPAVVGGGECVSCHSAYFTGHDHGVSGGTTEHTIQINSAVDLGQSDSQPCSNCH
ncbi:MAG: hypothetical protein Q8J76_12245, partial [Desulfobulbaceae bacterium]|nr:hypothetical protein [Desulfobulbaceae bacterium]